MASIRNLNWLENVGETLRATLNSLAVAAPDWLKQVIHPDWFDRYGKRVEEYRFPAVRLCDRNLLKSLTWMAWSYCLLYTRMIRQIGCVISQQWRYYLDFVKICANISDNGSDDAT